MNLRPQLGFVAITIAGTVSAAAILAGGCTVLTNDALPDDAGVFEGGEASAATCASCQAIGCAAPAALCLTDPDCLAIRSCAGVSGCDATCRTSCACRTSASDGGTSSGGWYRALARCLDDQTACASCGDAGSTTPGACEELDASAPDAANDAAANDAGADAAAADAAASDGGAPPSCRSCGSAKCDREESACAVGSECQKYLACAIACADATCVDDCGMPFETGKQAAFELAGCMRASCDVECGLDR